MKKYPLTTRAKALIITLLGVIVMNMIAMVLIDDIENRLSFLLFDIMVWCILLFCSYYFLWQPYKEQEKIYQRFLDGQVYEELFQVEDKLTPKWDQVMKQFQYLLNKQDAIRISKKQAEYLALQNQINPHFLYNTLEAIRGDALEVGMNSIAETTEALAIFFRYTITGVEHLVTLEDELDNVENYFIIQCYRFDEKIKLKILCSQEEVLQLKLPKLTLQPLVENAIFHGLEKVIEGGEVKIEIETTEEKLLISVVDDGVGMKEEVVDSINSYLERVAVSYVGEDRRSSGGIALKNVNSRIKLLFGEDYGIHLYSTQGTGTDVKVVLPKILRDEDEARIIKN